MAPQTMRLRVGIAAGIAAVLAAGLGVYAARCRFEVLKFLEPFDPVERTTTERGVQYRFHNFSVSLPATWKIAPKTQFNRRSGQMGSFQTQRGAACEVFFYVNFFHTRYGARPPSIEPVKHVPGMTRTVYGSRRIGGFPARTVSYQFSSKRVRSHVSYEWLVDRGEYWFQGSASWPAGKQRCRDEVMAAVDSLRFYPP